MNDKPSRFNTSQTWRDFLVNPDDGTHLIREAAQREFEDFVLGVWNQLVLMESRIIGGKTSKAIFCCINVGIRLGEGELPEYFVTDVECTPPTGLWLRGHNHNTMDTMADSFATVFRKWLGDARNAYIL